MNVYSAFESTLNSTIVSYLIVWRAYNFPQKWRGLGHVTPKLYGIQSNISPKLLQLETSNLV